MSDINTLAQYNQKIMESHLAVNHVGIMRSILVYGGIVGKNAARDGRTGTFGKHCRKAACGCS
jgi:hypothetical protein